MYCYTIIFLFYKCIKYFFRKKVLNQYQTAQNVPTDSNKKFSSASNQNSGLQPTFQKLKPGKLFQNNTENSNSFERFQTSTAECPTKPNKNSSVNSPGNASTSPPSPSLISPKSISSFKPVSSFPSTSGFAASLSFNKDKEPKKNDFENKDAFHSHNNNHMNSTVIEIQDIETQNLLDQTVYDIHEDDFSPGILIYLFTKKYFY